jgi:hypothetical protein
MKKIAFTAPLAFAVAALVALALPRRADAGMNVNVNVGLPAAPPLVVVQPGVQVVEDWDEEVFFVSGFYWVRRDGGWYRARSPRAAFVLVQPRVVPGQLVRIPPGQYVKYKKAKHDRRHDGRDGHRGGPGGGHGHHPGGHGKHKGKH